MRLLRRTLLCLIVGVSAFGASSWTLRPRPSWSVEIPVQDSELTLVDEETVAAPDAPIWVTYSLGEPGLVEPITAEARDPRDGSCLRRFELPGDVAKRTLPTGEILCLNYDRLANDDVKATTARCFSAMAAEPTSVVSLPGKWIAANNRRQLLRVECDSNGPLSFFFGTSRRGLSVAVADLRTGRILENRKFADCITVNGDHVVVSQDGGRVVVPESDIDGCRPPWGLKVFDLATGRCVRVPAPPENGKQPGQPEDAHFSDDAHSLDFAWNDHNSDQSSLSRRGVVNGSIRFVNPRRWRFEFATTKLTPMSSIAAPPPDLKESCIFDDHSLPDGTVWTAVNDAGDGWFCIEEKSQPAAPWRRFPYSLDRSFVGGGLLGFIQVPGRTELLVVSVEPSLATMVPDAIIGWLPANWQDTQQFRCRWHDWRANAWRDAGLPDTVTHWHVRTNALVTTSPIHEGLATLQSWPLPPRDPRPLALAIAALCTAATWWVCARRYRRRMQRAAVGVA